MGTKTQNMSTTYMTLYETILEKIEKRTLHTDNVKSCSNIISQFCKFALHKRLSPNSKFFFEIMMFACTFAINVLKKLLYLSENEETFYFSALRKI